MQLTPNTWSIKPAGDWRKTLVEVRGHDGKVWLLTVGAKGATREAIKLSPDEARMIADALLEAVAQLAKEHDD